MKEKTGVAKSAEEIRFLEDRDTIQQLTGTIADLSAAIARKDAVISELSERVADLSAQIDSMKRMLFGASRESTKYSYADSDQLSLFDTDDTEADPVSDDDATVTVKEHERRRKPTLEERFRDIVTEKVYVEPLSGEELECPVCGSEMVPFGEEVLHRELVYVRAQVKMLEYVGRSYKCTQCEDTGETQIRSDACSHTALIRGSYVSPSVAAWVFYQKFVMSVPFHRQEKAFEEFGAVISRATMANWAIKLSQEYLSHVTAYFHRKLVERQFLMLDESPVQVLDEEGRRPQSKSYVWIMRSGEDGLDPIVYYHYSPSRAGRVAAELTDGVSDDSYFMADGYSGYNALSNMKRCVCYAHIRRYFYEAIPRNHETDFTDLAVQGVMYCDRLFEYERRYAEKGLSYENRRKRRLKDEKPVVEAFLKWANTNAANAGGNGKLAKAFKYVLKRQKYMMTYLEDGRCSLSNNRTENAVRPVTVGRKNWLFSQSVDGAEANMTMYTLVEMAKLYGISSYRYIEFLLENRPDENTTDEELERLSPWNDEVRRICARASNES